MKSGERGVLFYNWIMSGRFDYFASFAKISENVGDGVKKSLTATPLESEGICRMRNPR